MIIIGMWKILTLCIQGTNAIKCQNGFIESQANYPYKSVISKQLSVRLFAKVAILTLFDTGIINSCPLESALSLKCH
jgi:hypothetical protein